MFLYLSSLCLVLCCCNNIARCCTVLVLKVLLTTEQNCKTKSQTCLQIVENVCSSCHKKFYKRFKSAWEFRFPVTFHPILLHFNYHFIICFSFSVSLSLCMYLFVCLSASLYRLLLLVLISIKNIHWTKSVFCQRVEITLIEL